MPIIVDLLDEVIANIENETVIASVGERVQKMMRDFPLFAY
jgi:glycine hydroxymethyltransferase